MVMYFPVISIVQLVPGSGQLNCTQWRKLNAYNNITKTGYCRVLETGLKTILFLLILVPSIFENLNFPAARFQTL